MRQWCVCTCGVYVCVYISMCMYAEWYVCQRGRCLGWGWKGVEVDFNSFSQYFCLKPNNHILTRMWFKKIQGRTTSCTLVITLIIIPSYFLDSLKFVDDGEGDHLNHHMVIFKTSFNLIFICSQSQRFRQSWLPASIEGKWLQLGYTQPSLSSCGFIALEIQCVDLGCWC